LHYFFCWHLVQCSPSCFEIPFVTLSRSAIDVVLKHDIYFVYLCLSQYLACYFITILSSSINLSWVSSPYDYLGFKLYWRAYPKLSPMLVHCTRSKFQVCLILFWWKWHYEYIVSRWIHSWMKISVLIVIMDLWYVAITNSPCYRSVSLQLVCINKHLHFS